MTDDEFRDLISESLTCRLSDGEDCGKTMDIFLDRCFYVPVRAIETSFSRMSYTCQRIGCDLARCMPFSGLFACFQCDTVHPSWFAGVLNADRLHEQHFHQGRIAVT